MRLGIIIPLDQLLPYLRSSSHFFRFEMFYIVSMYGLINLDALQSFMLLDENYVCTLVLMWWWTSINLVTYLSMWICNGFDTHNYI